MTTTKINGAAGCGKTTALMNKLEEYRDIGFEIGDISMVTLTKAGRDVFWDRAVKQYNIPEGEQKKALRWFGTLHQIAYKLINGNNTNFCPELGFKPNQITKSDDYRILLSEIDKISKSDKVRLDFLKYADLYHDYVRRFSGDFEFVDQNKFDRLIEISGVLRNYIIGDITLKGYYHYLDHTTGVPSYRNESGRYTELKPKEVVYFTQTMKAFLEDRDLLDYTRCMESFLYQLQNDLIEIPFDIIFLDEFQDFTPIQFEIFKELESRVLDTIIAGDPNQSIYGWIGASPNFMNSVDVEDDEHIILDKTYRFGKNGLINAEKYLKIHPNYTNHHIQPADHDDVVTFDSPKNWFKYVDKNVETVILHLMKKGVNETCQRLNDDNIPYLRLGSRSKWETLFEIYNILIDLEIGKNIEFIKIKKLLQHIPTFQESQIQQITISGESKTTSGSNRVLKNGSKKAIKNMSDDLLFNKNKFANIFLQSGRWDINLMKRVMFYRSQKIKLNVIEEISQTGVTFPDYGNVNNIKIWVGNIHKIKGAQRHRVILFRNVDFPITKYVDEATTDNITLQELCRVFYVGSTRHTHELIELGTGGKDGLNSVDIDYLVRNAKS